ncbi:MAG: hypothetical protein JO189_03565 [Deltaproteobacteria bacterium]|jgi:type IV secretory pathway TrbF-like protein|nr:hypothetical protein [Deltaproteobacteria bacterium]
MAAALKDSPLYTDRLTAWHNSRLWIAFLAAIGLAGILGIADVAQKFRPPPPPYVIEVNTHGEPVGQILPITSVQAIPNAILKAQLADFIHDAFSIDQDKDEEDRLVARTQARLTGQAGRTIDEWYQRDNGKHDPRNIWRYTWAEAMPLDALKLDGADRYQVDYRLTTHADNNTTITIAEWRATLHVIVGHSTDPASLGWFVDWMDFEQVRK